MKKISKFSFTLVTVVLLAMVAVFGVSALNVGTVSSLKATQTNTSISLSWKKAANATGYRVYEKVSGKWKELKTTTATSFKATSLKAGSKHTYAVKAYGKENGKTVWAKEFKTIATATRPSTVKTLKASQTTNTVTLSWSKAAGATGYRVFRYNTADKSWDIAVKATSKTSVTIKNLSTGKKYIFAVKPYFNTGSKIIWASTYTKVTTATKPAVPSKVTAKATASTVALSWTKSTGATGYRIYRYNASTKKWSTVATTANRTYTIKNLKAGTKYIFAVKPYISVDENNIWGSYKQITVKTTASSSTVSVPTSKAQIAAAYNKAVNDYRTYKGTVTFTKTEDIDIEVTDSSSAVLGSVVENLFDSLSGSYSETYVFKNGVDVNDPYRRLSDKICPYNRNAAVDPAGLASASAKANSDGGYTMTIKFTSEKSYFDGTSTVSEPVYHKGALDPLDFGVLDLGAIQIKKATTKYPGATIKATVDAKGRLIKLVVDCPLTAETVMKYAVEGTVDLEGEMDSVYTMKYN